MAMFDTRVDPVEVALDEYLRNYAEGSDETERRQRRCAICGDSFDMDDGKLMELYTASPIRIEKARPDYIYICDCCLNSAQKIESEDDYEY